MTGVAAPPLDGPDEADRAILRELRQRIAESVALLNDGQAVIDEATLRETIHEQVQAINGTPGKPRPPERSRGGRRRAAARAYRGRAIAALPGPSTRPGDRRGRPRPQLRMAARRLQTPAARHPVPH